MSNQGQSSHSSSSVFNDLRLSGELCDAVIKVEDAEFQIHRIVLCNCSSYFLSLFTRWSTSNQKVFEIPGLSPHTMQLIIEFAYNGFVSMTKANAQELLLAADQLNITDLLQTCFDFLEKQLCPENCIGIFQFTSICYSSQLERAAFRYITDHFEEVVLSEEFQQLSVQELMDILDRDDLNVRKESTVYEAVLQWIAHRPEERNRHITELLSKVRLGLIRMDYMMTNVMSNELVNSNTKCKDMVREAIESIRHMMTHSLSVSGLCNPLARPRLPNSILLAIGGWSGHDPTNGIEAYDIRTDSWVNVTDNREHPRAYHGSAFLNGSVYCVGGFDRLEFFNSVRRFDLTTHTWHEVACMYYRRCYVSVTVLNGYIYAMGGYDGHARLNTAECFKPEINQWSLIAPMHEHRSDASCTTLHSKIYICGGFNGSECLQTAECFSTETNQWTLISPMSSRRSGIGVVAYADRVYAVGGFDGNNRLCSAEAYNPQTNTWHQVSSMMTTRSNFGIEVLDEWLFVVGGFEGFTTTFNVEYYNAATNEWNEACDMEIFRSALSCCVVSGLPNITEYVVPRDSVLLFEDESEESDESED